MVADETPLIPHSAAIDVMGAPRPRLPYSLGIWLAFHTSPPNYLDVVGSVPKPGIGSSSYIPCYISLFSHSHGARRVIQVVDFLPVYIIAR